MSWIAPYVAVPRMRSVAGALCRRRYYVLALVAAYVWFDALRAAYWFGGDWLFFVRGASALTGSHGLHTYAVMPDLQFGPIALLLTVPLRHLGPYDGWIVTSAICMALGLVAIRQIECAVIDVSGRVNDARLTAGILVGGVFVLQAWSVPAVGEGHLDDVLALVGVAFAIRFTARRRWTSAAVAIGLAAGAKPWALLVLALLMVRPTSRWRGPVVAAIVAALPWLPFVIADSATIDVTKFRLAVTSMSGLHFLGVPIGATPGWARLTQLVVAVGLGAWAVRERRWQLIPLLAFAVRVNLDPVTFRYYAAGVIVGALIWDAYWPTQLPGMRVVGVWIALLGVPEDGELLHIAAPVQSTVVGLLRLATLIVPLVALALSSRQRRLASAVVLPRQADPAIDAIPTADPV